MSFLSFSDSFLQDTCFIFQIKCGNYFEIAHKTDLILVWVLFPLQTILECFLSFFLMCIKEMLQVQLKYWTFWNSKKGEKWHKLSPGTITILHHVPIQYMCSTTCGTYQCTYASKHKHTYSRCPHCGIQHKFLMTGDIKIQFVCCCSYRCRTYEMMW